MRAKTKVKIFFALITAGLFLSGVPLASAKTKAVEGFGGVIA